MSEEKDLEITQKEIRDLDTVAHNIVLYSEDDRRKADDLYSYYQELITGGDNKEATREGLAKSLELKEMSVNNLVEILKLKTRLLEKKIVLEIKRQGNYEAGPVGSMKRTGFNTSELISDIDGAKKDGQ